MNIYLTLTRTFFKILSKVAPHLAGSLAFHLFQKPRTKAIRTIEKSFYDQVTSYKIETPIESVDCYELGNKQGKLIILVHGWESNAGSFAAISASLANQGYRVVLFNLPAHGISKLKKANIMSCSRVLASVLTYFQYSGPISIISHSFGSAVCTYTLATTRVPIDKFIMLTTPDKLIDIFTDFKHMISLGDVAFNKMLDDVKELFGRDPGTVAVNQMTKMINYNQLSIIHDEYDKVLPYHNSLKVYEKSRNANLTTLEKVGHYRMLWNKEVIAMVNNLMRHNQKAA
ncbi:MAG: alpha/beta fold hydrolase [Bacteroidetes bacterium]|nr:alpha/beta fold hydrolase [Bacteroidota bacterium]MDA1122402.1 alpha/beta fold hydrolase [Bacteroidota bacterium]